MRAVVTGATGFVGAHVTQQLSDRAGDVRVVYRNSDRLARLKGVEFRRAKGDVLAFAAMRRACKGADVLFHTVVFVGSRPPGPVWTPTPRAPGGAVEAAAAEGLERVVLTSTVSAVGPAADGRPATEADE